MLKRSVHPAKAGKSLYSVIGGLFLLVFFSGETFAGSWAKTYGEVDEDDAWAMCAISGGGCVITGITRSFGHPDGQWFVMELNSGGDTVWSKDYGTDKYDWAYSIINTQDGGYMVSGEARSGFPHWRDFGIIKLNSTGTVEWAKLYGDSGTSCFDYNPSCTQTADGGYIIAGRTMSFGVGDYRPYVVKLNSLGNLEWQKVYEGDQKTERPYRVSSTPDSGCILVGQTLKIGEYWDVLAIKLDSDGAVEWANGYDVVPGDEYDELARFVVPTSDGYILAGNWGTWIIYESDVLVMKLNFDGSVNWARKYGGIENERAYGLDTTSDGNYIVAGGTASFGDSLGDVFVIKLAPDGGIIWSRTFGDTATEEAHGVVQATDGCYILAGYTTSWGVGEEVLALKMEQDGSMDASCPIQPCSPSIDTPPVTVYPITFTDFSPGVGEVWTPDTHSIVPQVYDICPPSGIEEEGTIHELPLLVISPSVGNEFQIQYKVPGGGEPISLRIYDSAGRLVKVLAEGKCSSGSYNIRWDSKDCGVGTYFCELKVDGKNIRKIIVVR